MEQLPGLLIYMCVAVIAPVVLARFVVRAEWRTIRNACAIWYGFLFLAFGAFASGEGVGWALIFAMFFSIAAVPIIALVLSGWSWLGRSQVAVASAGAGPPWLQRFPLSLMSPAQWAAVALVVTGGFVGIYWYEQRDLNARADILRPFLGLPAGTKFTSIQSRTSPVASPRVAATVRFTEPAFNAFAAQLDRVPLWKNNLPNYDGAPVEVASPENIRWRDVPLPVQAGNHVVNWTELSAREIKNLRRGRVLCIALQRNPGNQRSRQNSDVPRFAARDCSELAKTERVQLIVIGALDFETRTLHMLIN